MTRNQSLVSAFSLELCQTPRRVGSFMFTLAASHAKLAELRAIRPCIRGHLGYTSDGYMSRSLLKWERWIVHSTPFDLYCSQEALLRFKIMSQYNWMMVTKVLLLCGCIAPDTIAPSRTGSNANNLLMTEVSNKQDLGRWAYRTYVCQVLYHTSNPYW